MSKTSTYIWAVVVIAIVVVGGILLSRQSANGPETAQDAVGTQVVQETGPIRIGAVGPLTGDAATYGIALQRAYDLTAEQINAAGGVNGRLIELIHQDGKCEGAAATTAVQTLLSIEKVKFVLGGTCSGETLAMAPITQAARAMLITAASTNPTIAQAGDLVFRTYPHDAAEASLVAKYADQTLNFTKAAIISEQTDFAQGVRNAFKPDWSARDLELVFDETYNTGDTDFRTQITKLKGSGAQMLYLIPQTATSAELILKQMQEAGVSMQIFGANALIDTKAFVEKSSLYNGMILAHVSLDKENSITKEYLAAYEAKYKEAPNFEGYQAAARDAIYLLAEALGSVGESPDKVAEYFNTQVKDWSGALGAFNFDENGDAVINLTLFKVVDGQSQNL